MNEYIVPLSLESSSQEQPVCPFPEVDAEQVVRWTNNVPLILQACSQWVVWHAAYKDGKWKKEPWNFRSLRLCSIKKPENYLTFIEAVEAAAKSPLTFRGIGLALTEQDDFVAIDLDKCIDDKGEISDEAQKIINYFQSYTEISPSRTGIRIFITAKAYVGRKDSNKGIEVYSKERYMTLTGRTLPGFENIRACQVEFEEWFEQVFPKKEARPTKSRAKVSFARNPGSFEPLREEDMHLLEKAKKAPKGVGEEVVRLWEGDMSDVGNDHSKADSRLTFYLAFWNKKKEHSERVEQLDRIFRHSSLFRDKWDERRGDSTYGWDTIEDAISRQLGPTQPRRDARKATADEVSTTDVEKSQQPQARRERTHRNKAETPPTIDTTKKVPGKRGGPRKDAGDLFQRLREDGRWLSLKQIRELAPHIPTRTLQELIKDAVKSGILEPQGFRTHTLYKAKEQTTLFEADV